MDGRSVGAMPGGWQDATERTLAVTFGCWVGGLLLFSWSDAWRAATINAFDGVMVTTAVVVLAGTVLAVWTVGPRPIVAMTGTALIALVHLTATSREIDYGIHWWGFQHCSAYCGLLAGSLSRRVATIWVASFMCTETVVFIRAHVPTAELTWWVTVMAMMAMMVGCSVLMFRRTADVADRAAVQNLTMFIQQEGLVAAGRAEREIARRLHDDVAHALRACSLPRPAMTPEALLDHCSTALRSLRNSAGQDLPRNLSAALNVLSRRCTMPVELRLDGVDATLPPHVADGIIGILAEAFRNIERHAGLCRVEVTSWAYEKGGVAIRVADDGRGFDTARSGFGLTASVRQRARDVGAQVTVSSRPGHGTAMTVLWPEPAPAETSPTHDDLADGAGTRRRLVYGALVPGALGNFVAVAARPERLTQPMSATITMLCLVACVVVALQAGRRRPNRAESLAIMICSPLALLAESAPWGFAADAPTCPFPGVLAPFSALIAFYRPVRETLPGMVALATTVLVLEARSGGQIGVLISASIQAVLPYTLVLVVRLLLDRAGDVVARTAAAQTELAAAQQRDSALQLVGEARLQRIRAQVEPFLREVVAADGMISDATRVRAIVLEAAVRDDLKLGTQLDQESRTLIESCRARGLSVQLNLTDLPTDGVLFELLRAAVDDLDQGSPSPRLVISRGRGHELTCLLEPAQPAAGAVRIAAHGGHVRTAGQIGLYSLPLSCPEQPTSQPE